MQALLGSAKAPVNSPVLISGANSATEAVRTLHWIKDITFGDEDGANRLLVIVYGTEGTFSNVHGLHKYNGVFGVVIGSKTVTAPASGTFFTATVSASYWLEANLPSSAGDYAFDVFALLQAQEGHHARAFLFKNVDQANPVGAMQTRTQLVGVPTYQMPITASSLQDKAVALAVQSAVIGPTYVTGDHRDAGSNMVDLIEQQARPAATIFGGGAFASSYDIVPDSNEDYIWDMDYGSTTLVQASTSILVPINVAP